MSALQTFTLPDSIGTRADDHELGRAMVRAWQTDGIFQVAARPDQDETTRAALASSRRFFGLPLTAKSTYVSDLTYSGYIASGEETTAGEADFSEIFTVCKDVPADDPRVTGAWPCHGPVPWPDSPSRGPSPT